MKYLIIFSQLFQFQACYSVTYVNQHGTRLVKKLLLRESKLLSLILFAQCKNHFYWDWYQWWYHNIPITNNKDIANKQWSLYCIFCRCVAEDEQLTLAAINMKLPFVKFSKVEPTKDGQKIQQSIGTVLRIKIYQ